MSRLGIAAILMPTIFCAAGLPASHVSVLVVSEPAVSAYAEALAGIGGVLPQGTTRVMDLTLAGFDRDLAAALEDRELRVVIAVGSRAMTEVKARHAAVPVIASMTLRSTEADTVRRVGLDLPLATQLQSMRALWPRKLRVGIIRGPAQSRNAADSLEAIARKEGFTPVVVDCASPAQLLKAVAALQGKVDFVLCFPDAELYNPVTVKPLVLASLERRLPLVGYSPAFVRAGAAAGLFPDYRDLGRQAAEMALSLLRGEDRPWQESPRKILAAINQRVTRLLGVEFAAGALGAEIYR